MKAMEAFLEEKIAPKILPLLLTNDLEALAAAARARPNMEDMQPRLNIPCLLFSFSMVIQDIVAMGFGSKLHYRQPICIADLIFVPNLRYQLETWIKEQHLLWQSVNVNSLPLKRQKRSVGRKST